MATKKQAAVKKATKKSKPKGKSYPKNTSKKSSQSKTSKRRYEGASKSKRLSRWQTSSTSANAETRAGLVTLRNRSRDLRRNNPYAKRAVEAISCNVVGEGILTQFRGDNPNIERIETQWADWAESTAIDYDGQSDIYGLQSLIMDAVAESGEVLIRYRFNRKMQIPLQLQVLESDYIDTEQNFTDTKTGNVVVQGIEFDKQGRRVAYYLFENHPGGGDAWLFNSSVTSNRVPANEILHVYRKERPGQVRGVPWLSAVIVRLKDLDDYEDAQLLRQKIAACFTAFIRDLSADLTDEDENCEEDDPAERLEPGIIEHLPPGKTVEFGNPPEVQNYDQYLTKILQGIAVGVGVTYEVLTNDYSNVNFSSGRMGWIEFHRNLKRWRQNIMYTQALNPIAKAFLTILAIQGVDVEGVRLAHVPPKREMIDPVKETAATIKGIRAGITTLSDEIMAQGKDPEEHLEQYKKDQELLDELGLKLDSDPRQDEKGSEGGDNADIEGGLDENAENKIALKPNKGVIPTRVIRPGTKHNGFNLDHGRASEAVDVVRRRIPRRIVS